MPMAGGGGGGETDSLSRAPQIRLWLGGLARILSPIFMGEEGAGAWPCQHRGQLLPASR